MPRLIGFYLLVWVPWILSNALIVWLARRFPVAPPKTASVAVHTVAAFAVALVHELYWIALLLTMQPFDRMNPDAKKLKLVSSLFECLPIELVLYGLVLGVSVAFDYYGRYRERTLQAAKLEASLAEARLYALELQIPRSFSSTR